MSQSETVKDEASDNKILNYMNVNMKAVQFAENENQFSKFGVKDIPSQCNPFDWTLVIYVIVGILILTLLFGGDRKVKDYFTGVSPLARQLSDAGWVLVSRSTCPFCVKQKAVVGDNYPGLVECDTGVTCLSSQETEQICSQVNAYPTWINTKTGQKQEGYMQEDQLMTLV